MIKGHLTFLQHLALECVRIFLLSMLTSGQVVLFFKPCKQMHYIVCGAPVKIIMMHRPKNTCLEQLHCYSSGTDKKENMPRKDEAHCVSDISMMAIVSRKNERTIDGRLQPNKAYIIDLSKFGGPLKDL